MDPQACMVQTTDALGKKMTTEYSQASGISHFVVKKGTNDFFFAVGTEMGTVEMLKLKNVGKWKRLAHVGIKFLAFLRAVKNVKFVKQHDETAVWSVLVAKLN